MTPLQLVALERNRQDDLWPGHTCADQMDNGLRLAILTEEVGEVARELCEAAQHDRAVDTDKLRTELVQVAAIAVAWVEALSKDDVVSGSASGEGRTTTNTATASA